MDRTSPNAPQAAIEAEDYYYDGPYMVFTAAYHLKRGSCCQSGCRHCPYGFAPEEAGTPGEEDPSVG